MRGADTFLEDLFNMRRLDDLLHPGEQRVCLCQRLIGHRTNRSISKVYSVIQVLVELQCSASTPD
ncbi:hypothetical protein D8I24_7347 [Cupriavidus necator H850]|uniref:hypothetical protein n=1 Tax=Cupriavidus necator TaxID=106590 RepID=UPI00129E2AC5|nr:hypothetical protein [Cupriavidus necator]KAI3596423.1 hypothetical protein D8I24_7347 [Cupriavidus necator H850]